MPQNNLFNKISIRKKIMHSRIKTIALLDKFVAVCMSKHLTRGEANKNLPKKKIAQVTDDAIDEVFYFIADCCPNANITQSDIRDAYEFLTNGVHSDSDFFSNLSANLEKNQIYMNIGTLEAAESVTIKLPLGIVSQMIGKKEAISLPHKLVSMATEVLEKQTNQTNPSELVDVKFFELMPYLENLPKMKIRASQMSAEYNKYQEHIKLLSDLPRLTMEMLALIAKLQSLETKAFGGPGAQINISPANDYTYIDGSLMPGVAIEVAYNLRHIDFRRGYSTELFDLISGHLDADDKIIYSTDFAAIDGHEQYKLEQSITAVKSTISSIEAYVEEVANRVRIKASALEKINKAGLNPDELSSLGL